MSSLFSINSNEVHMDDKSVTDDQQDHELMAHIVAEMIEDSVATMSLQADGSIVAHVGNKLVRLKPENTAPSAVKLFEAIETAFKNA